MYDRSSYGRVRPNLSLSGQVSVGAQSVGPLPCFVWRLDGLDLDGGPGLCAFSAEALVHVAEATSIVAEATTLISIYTSECHLLVLTHGSRPHRQIGTALKANSNTAHAAVGSLYPVSACRAFPLTRRPRRAPRWRCRSRGRRPALVPGRGRTNSVCGVKSDRRGRDCRLARVARRGRAIACR